MRRQSWLVRTALCMPALMGATLLTQCGPSDRQFGKGSAGAGSGGLGAAGSSGGTHSAGRGGSSGSHAGAAGHGDAGESQAGETGDAGATSSAGSTGTAGSDGSAGSIGVAGSSGSAGSGGSGPNPLPVGATCAKNGDCELGNCIDGVCCESACTGCKACSSAQTGKSDGICAPVLDGKDPHNTCADVTATNDCGTDGACNGAGACRMVASSHVCKAASCSGSTFTPASTCDGLGTCKAATAENCGASTCSTSGCLKACTVQSECSASSYCKITSGTSGTCTAKNPNGTAATQTFECTSGVVADGVCCNQACSGCMACSGSPATGSAAGTCANALSGQDPHNTCTASGVTCGLDGFCDGAGACRSSPLAGAACTSSNKCLTNTKCSGGTCGGTAVTCNGASGCKKAGVCNTSTGCVYDNVDEGTTCDDGSGCTTPDKCSAGVCVGGPSCTTDSTKPSCNTSTKMCACRIKDAGNLFTNPNFDTSLSGWDAGGKTFRMDPDMENCTGSKSVFHAQGASEGYPQQCVTVLANAKYYFGVTYTGGGSPGDSFEMEFYSGANCTGGLLGSLVLACIDPSTAPNVVKGKTSTTTPAGTASARFRANMYLRGFDQPYFSQTDKF